MRISNEHATNPGIYSRLGINHFVSHHLGMLWIHVVLGDEFLDHLARRFAAMTIIVRGMGAYGEVFKRVKLVQAHIILKLAVDNINRF